MNKCGICGREFKNPQGLAGHNKWIHNQPGRKQLRLFPTKRFITDSELIELFRKRDETNHQNRMDLLDLFDKRTKQLLGEIQRLDNEQLDLKKEFANIYKRLNKVKVKVKV